MKSSKEILNQFEEWKNDWASHALFCSYDRDPSEEYIIQFWKKAITKLFEGNIFGTLVTIDELKLSTERKGRFPSGLKEIIEELVSRGELIRHEDLQEIIKDKQAAKGWITWAGRKIKGLWRSSSKNFTLVNISKVKKTTEVIKKKCLEENRSVFDVSELLEITETTQDELKVVLDYLEVQNAAQRFEENIDNKVFLFVKIKTSEKDGLTIKPEESAMINLKKCLKIIDYKLEELNKQIEISKNKILIELRNKNKTAAKNFLIMKKNLEKNVEQLLGSRINLETQILSIDQCVLNVGVINALKMSNETLKQFSMDLGEVDKVIEENKVLIEESNEVGNVLAEGVVSSNENIEEEFEKLDQEDYSVPSFELPRKKHKAKEEDEDVVESNNILMA